MLYQLFQGVLVVLRPQNLIFISVGTLVGLLSGATPGISGTMAVALLIPLTYTLDAGSAFLILVATYAAAAYSGSISAILYRTPGAPEAVATTLDGYPMARQGRAGEALGWALSASALGGLVGSLVLITVSPQLARVALKFGSAEYFALGVLGLSVVASLGGNNLYKGLVGALLGLFLATVGIDPITGTPRFTFGMQGLMGGIDFIPVMIGLFAISEVMRRMQQEMTVQKLSGRVAAVLPRWSAWRPFIGLLVRSSLIGTGIGILPGIGATTAAVVGYSEAVRWSRHPEKFGTGIPEGIIGPESANNAAANGALVPLLALGIPGSATTAVMLGAFMLHGLRPGPLLFSYNAKLVYTIFAGSLLSNLLILLYAQPFIRVFARVVNVPFTVLGPLIIVLCTLGSYGVRNSIVDVWVMILCGALGYVLEKHNFPLAPIILGLVLGGLAEEEFRRAIMIAGGNRWVFLQRPISCALLILAVASATVPLVIRALATRRRGNIATAT